MKPRVLVTGAGAVCGAGRDPDVIFASPEEISGFISQRC